MTYIQSGNVIFDTTVKNKADLKIVIEEAIEDKYKFHVPVEIRTNHEIGDIIKSCPFDSVNLVADGTKVLIMFLSSTPQAVKVSDIQKYVVAPEKLVVRETEVYLHCPKGLCNNIAHNLTVRQT